jgi:VanZ family protein
VRTEAEGEGSARGGFPLFRLKRDGRLRRYGPVVAWVGVIFFFSTSGFSAPNTSRIVRPLLLWLFPDMDEPTLAAAHGFVRKAAHFIEYAVLALLAARAFLTSSRAGLRRRWPAAAFALVAACSVLDEFHQSLLAARTGTVYDSLLDMSGGAAALALLAAWRRAPGEGRRP